jgi:hypothetical protein
LVRSGFSRPCARGGYHACREGNPGKIASIREPAQDLWAGFDAQFVMGSCELRRIPRCLLAEHTFPLPTMPTDISFDWLTRVFCAAGISTVLRKSRLKLQCQTSAGAPQDRHLPLIAISRRVIGRGVGRAIGTHRARHFDVPFSGMILFQDLRMQLMTRSRTSDRGWKWIIQGHGFPSEGNKAWIGDGVYAECECAVMRRSLDTSGKCWAGAFRS